MRASGSKVSIGVASLCLVAAMPIHAHVNGGMPYSWWYWLARAHWHDHGGGHGHGGGNGHGNGHGGGHHGGHNGGHGGGHNGGHNGGHGHGHGGGHGGPGPGNGNGCPPASGGSPSSASTWAGGQCTTSSSNWSDRSNWSAGAPPSGPTVVAEFGASRVTTINFDTTSTLGTLQFNAGAPAYTFNIGSPYTLTLAGAGIRNLATGSPTFNVSGRLNFTNGASAGNAALVAAAGGIIDFSGVTSGVPTAGSIAGAGTLNLGRNTLNVGSLNTSTTFSGSISEGTLRGGSLRKAGTGTLTLTGASNYTGSTTIAGMLEVVQGGRVEGTSGITVADLAADVGTLRVSGAQSKIGTSGTLVVGNAGRGILTLDEGAAVNASSIFLGAAAGSSGTLNIGSGGLAGALSAANVAAGSGAATLNVNHSQSAYTLASDLLGRLTVNHNGSGTTTLTGANAYSGGTYLNAGVIRISTNTQLGGASNGLYFNGGTLQTSATITGFTHPVVLNSRGGAIDTGAFNVTTSGAFSGTGRLTKTGTGTLTLNGASTYTGGTTVSAGTLRGTSSSLVGNIINNGAVAFLQSGSGEYSGVMSGNGSLTKFNPGTLVLSGASTFTGGTTISTGALVVNGSLASAVAVDEGGTLSGIGTINAPVTISGVLAPGVGGTGSIGTLTVRNSVTFGDGSFYRVDAESGGRADRINASGAVTIGEAAVEVVANPAGTWAPNTSYTIVTASGGVSGQFADVTTDLAFLTPSLSYTGNNVNLTLTRNDATFSSVARSKKQSVTAAYLQELDARADNDNGTNAVISSVMRSSAVQARNGFEQISGSDLTRASRVSMANTAKLVDMLVARSTGQGIWMRSLDDNATDAALSEQGDGRSSTFEWRRSGILAGFDAALNDETSLGLSVSYARSNVMLNEQRDAFADVRTPQAMLYATSEQGSLQLNGVAGYARPTYRTERKLAFLGGAAAAADHSAREVSLYVEAAPALSRSEGNLLRPLLAVRYVRSAEDRYSESGSAGGLAVKSRTSQSLTSEAGVRFARELVSSDGTFELRAVWSRDYAGTSSSLTAHLASDMTGEAFTVADTAAARDRFVLNMKLSARVRDLFSLRFDCSVDAPVGAPVRKLVSVGVERTW